MKNILKGTLTEENLLKAFAGESQARNRYDYFASRAKKDAVATAPSTPTAWRTRIFQSFVTT